jgi:hypothetical protein
LIPVRGEYLMKFKKNFFWMYAVWCLSYYCICKNNSISAVNEHKDTSKNTHMENEYNPDGSTFFRSLILYCSILLHVTYFHLLFRRLTYNLC